MKYSTESRLSGKAVRKEDQAPTSSPSFNSQFCCPSSELCQHTSLPLTVNLHTPSLSYIHSPLTCQSLPATFDRPLASSLQTSLTINIAMNLPMWLPTLPSPPFFTQLTQWDDIYIYDGFSHREVLRSLFSPASTIYALIVLNTKESKNQYPASHYGSTFEAVPIGGSLGVQSMYATPLVWLRLALTMLWSA